MADESRRHIRYFLSYARVDSRLVDTLLRLLRPRLKLSLRHDFVEWRDTGILPGQNWQCEIELALTSCEVGLLMLSPDFLASQFIAEKELPRLCTPEKMVIPVLLRPINVEHRQTSGLDRLKHFGLSSSIIQSRAYSYCRGAQRDRFVEQLYVAIEQRLSCQTLDFAAPADPGAVVELPAETSGREVLPATPIGIEHSVVPEVQCEYTGTPVELHQFFNIDNGATLTVSQRNKTWYLRATNRLIKHRYRSFNECVIEAETHLSSRHLYLWSGNELIIRGTPRSLHIEVTLPRPMNITITAHA